MDSPFLSEEALALPTSGEEAGERALWYELAAEAPDDPAPVPAQVPAGVPSWEAAVVPDEPAGVPSWEAPVLGPSWEAPVLAAQPAGDEEPDGTQQGEGPGWGVGAFASRDGVTVEVAELLALWNAAAALNERIRLMVAPFLDQGATPRYPAPIPLAREYADGEPEPAGTEFEGGSPDDIKKMIDKGLSENDIANEVFAARNPKLAGQALRAGSAEARRWRAIRDGEVRPALVRSLERWIVDPVLLATYFSQYEDDKRVTAKAKGQFLLRPPLLSMGRTLRDRVLWTWRSGQPPLTLTRLYQMALDVSRHPATAMLLCHNVTKAFAKGGTAIHWQRTAKGAETYTDGRKTWTPAVVHPAGKIVKRFSKDANRDVASIYYLLFDARELDTTDPGDWYHYFVTATMAAYGAAGELSPSAPVRELEEDEGGPKDRVIGPTGQAFAGVYALLVRDRLLDLERQMSNPDLVDLPGYRGWVLANVMSFLEGGFYAESQRDAARESRWHLRGALVGLRTAGIKPGKTWAWYVPIGRSLSEEDLANGFQLVFKTAEVLDPNGQRLGPVRKGSPHP